MYQILLVEDEYHLREIIKEYFAMKEIEVIEASQGYEALDKLNDQIDLVLLDIMMPGIDGYEVCRKIRESYAVPIIFISALSEDENQLLAYELGADDYMIKPFRPSVLYAKSLAVLRRVKQEVVYTQNYGKISIDKNSHLLSYDGKKIPLTDKEFELLDYLCQHQGKLLAREHLLSEIWGYDYYGDGRAVDTYIKKLRKKLGIYACYIQTIVKTGYLFKVVDINEENDAV